MLASLIHLEIQTHRGKPCGVNRTIPRFLLAYYLINDAMVTVLYFTAIFMKTTFGLSMREILLLSLVFQLVAIPSTIFFGWLGDRWNQYGAIYPAPMIWALVLALMGFAEGVRAPLAISITLGLVLGSTQSLLRSMYAQRIPPNQSGEYFGFHALAGRASSALGPLLFGVVSALAGSQRFAMLSRDKPPSRRQSPGACRPSAAKRLTLIAPTRQHQIGGHSARLLPHDRHPVQTCHCACTEPTAAMAKQLSVSEDILTIILGSPYHHSLGAKGPA